MKEAIIVGLDGRYQEPTLVSDEQTGVTPLYAATEPQKGVEEPAEPKLVGHTVAVRVPEGLYQPRWDFNAEVWAEGLTPTEIEELRNAPQPVTPEQRIASLEAANTALQSDNLTLMEAIAELYEAMQGGAA